MQNPAIGEKIRRAAARPAPPVGQPGGGTPKPFTPLMERAAFNSAFGFERRVGLSATYSGKDVLVQAGVFSDDFIDAYIALKSEEEIKVRTFVHPLEYELYYSC